VLERLGGILLGRPGGQIPPETFQEYDDALCNTIRGEYGLDELAIVTNMDFGHTDPMFVIPLGLQARINSANQQISIDESAVKPVASSQLDKYDCTSQHS
jgi:muramoyltetrapeptide carboxypeptidase LdcA involved in peptidoglycan recycling